MFSNKLNIFDTNKRIYNEKFVVIVDTNEHIHCNNNSLLQCPYKLLLIFDNKECNILEIVLPLYYNVCYRIDNVLELKPYKYKSRTDDELIVSNNSTSNNNNNNNDNDNNNDISHNITFVIQSSYGSVQCKTIDNKSKHEHIRCFEEWKNALADLKCVEKTINNNNDWNISCNTKWENIDEYKYPQDDEVRLRGTLEKLGRFLSTFTQRSYVLKGLNNLIKWDSKHNKPLKTHNLQHIIVFDPANINNINNNNNTFLLCEAGQRSLVFRCDSIETKRLWIKELQLYSCIRYLINIIDHKNWINDIFLKLYKPNKLKNTILSPTKHNLKLAALHASNVIIEKVTLKSNDDNNNKSKTSNNSLVLSYAFSSYPVSLLTHWNIWSALSGYSEFRMTHPQFGDQILHEFDKRFKNWQTYNFHYFHAYCNAVESKQNDNNKSFFKVNEVWSKEMESNLKLILIGLSQNNVDIQYCTQLTYIATLILMNDISSGECYSFLQYLISISRPTSNQTPTLLLSAKSTVVMYLTFVELIRLYYPVLYLIINNNDDNSLKIINNSDPLFIWFRTWCDCVFLNSLPFHTALKLIDVLMYEGQICFLTSALSLLDIHQDSLSNYKSISTFVEHLNFVASQQIDCGRILLKMVQLNVPNNIITTLNKKIMENLDNKSLQIVLHTMQYKHLVVRGASNYDLHNWHRVHEQAYDNSNIIIPYYTFAYNIQEISTILKHPEESILVSMLPIKEQQLMNNYKCSLLYSTTQHGFSLRTLYRQCKNISVKCCFLIVKSNKDEVFGAYLNRLPTEKDAFSTSDSEYLFYVRPIKKNKAIYAHVDNDGHVRGTSINPLHDNLIIRLGIGGLLEIDGNCKYGSIGFKIDSTTRFIADCIEILGFSNAL